MGSPPRLVLFACLLVALPAATGLRPRPAPPASAPEPTPHVPGINPDAQKKIEQALEAKDSAALLGYFRQRTPDRDTQAKVRALIRQLGDDSFEVRREALAKLSVRGPGVAALLRQARRDADPEVARRAEQAQAQNHDTASTSLLVAAVKHLAEHPTADTAGVLLLYHPWAEDEGLAEAIAAALARLAQSDRKVAERLAVALRDADPLVRAAAALALGGPETRDHHTAVRKLLQDRHAAVRSAAGQALLGAHDRAAVAVLLDQLPGLSEAEAWQLLDRFASVDGSPPIGPGRDAAGRRRCHRAWTTWWRDHGEGVDLAALAKRSAQRQQTVLLVQSDGGAQAVFLDADNKLRGRLESLEGSLSIEWVGGSRLLLADYEGKQVRELDTKNDEVWKFQAGRPVVSAQRLDDNTTLVACRNRVVKVDGKGKEVWRYSHGTRSIAAARAGPGGTVVLLLDDGTCVVLDDRGKERHRFATGSPAPLGCGFEVLPGGSILVPCHTLDSVREFDPQGEVIWEVSAAQPVCARRLPAGRTLIGTLAPLVIEVDRQGTQHWTYTPAGKPLGVDRR